MFRRSSGLTALGALSVVLIMCLPAFAQSPKEMVIEQEFKPEEQKFPDDPGAGFVVMDEGLWKSLSEQPQQEFKSAIESLADGDAKKAANDIRRAAAFTRLAGGHSLPATQLLLYGRLKDLVNLADAVESGKVSLGAQLSPAFARTLEALAEHHAARAEKFWSSGKDQSTGQNLAAAVQDFRWAVEWGAAPSTPTRDAAMDDADAVGLLLQKKGSVARQDVTSKIDRLVTELQTYRAVLSPPAK